jgi:hypothetical protein
MEASPEYRAQEGIDAPHGLGKRPPANFAGLSPH